MTLLIGSVIYSNTYTHWGKQMLIPLSTQLSGILLKIILPSLCFWAVNFRLAFCFFFSFIFGLAGFIAHFLVVVSIQFLSCESGERLYLLRIVDHSAAYSQWKAMFFGNHVAGPRAPLLWFSASSTSSKFNGSFANSFFLSLVHPVAP